MKNTIQVEVRRRADLRQLRSSLLTEKTRSRKQKKKLDDIEAPELYTETREDNIGYDSFESNSDIVDSIAKIFPVFFFLIAALVCSTTMSRMIEEERSQIGTLRALGYTRGKIMWKYMVYSGSAAMIGCIAGFFAGSKYFPYAIWIAYGMMFGFAPIEFYFSGSLALISLVVSLLCSTGNDVSCLSRTAEGYAGGDTQTKGSKSREEDNTRKDRIHMESSQLSA